MIIREIFVENFLNFKGKHEFKFQKGVNYVFGAGMAGKSNLVNSVQFAILGLTGRHSTSSLINFEHKRECKDRDETCFCKVEVIIEHQSRSYCVRRSLSMNGKGEHNHYAIVPPEIAEIITAENFKYFHIDELASAISLRVEEHPNYSSADRMKTAIIACLKTNIKLGLRIVVLDGILACFHNVAARDFMHEIRRMGMDQVIIMDKQTDSDKLRQRGMGAFDDDERSSKIIILPDQEQTISRAASEHKRLDKPRTPVDYNPSLMRTEFKRDFICFDGRCRYCNGLLLVFKIKTLTWGFVSDEEREMFRERVERGKTLKDIVEEHPIGVDDELLGICEKCGRAHYFWDPELYHPNDYVE
jgi:endonuclease V-like protein UPF0215 family